MKYPRIRDTFPLKRTSQAVCALCVDRARFKAHVQVNDFRGDDMTTKVCKRHRSSQHAESILSAIDEHRCSTGA